MSQPAHKTFTYAPLWNLMKIHGLLEHNHKIQQLQTGPMSYQHIPCSLYVTYLYVVPVPYIGQIQPNLIGFILQKLFDKPVCDVNIFPEHIICLIGCLIQFSHQSFGNKSINLELTRFYFQKLKINKYKIT